MPILEVTFPTLIASMRRLNLLGFFFVNNMEVKFPILIAIMLTFLLILTELGKGTKVALEPSVFQKNLSSVYSTLPKHHLWDFTWYVVVVGKGINALFKVQRFSNILFLPITVNLSLSHWKYCFPYWSKECHTDKLNLAIQFPLIIQYVPVYPRKVCLRKQF